MFSATSALKLAIPPNIFCADTSKVTEDANEAAVPISREEAKLAADSVCTANAEDNNAFATITAGDSELSAPAAGILLVADIDIADSANALSAADNATPPVTVAAASSADSVLAPNTPL
jgi:hypothetical protein